MENDSENKAWNNFVSSGSVIDYLAYSGLKSQTDVAVKPESKNARKTDHRRTGDKGKKYR